MGLTMLTKYVDGLLERSSVIVIYEGSISLSLKSSNKYDSIGHSTGSTLNALIIISGA